MSSGSGLRLRERAVAPHRVQLALVDSSGGAEIEACCLTIDHLRMHDGAGGRIIVGGIGNVATLEAWRRRGLASELLKVAIQHMRAAGCDASLLYGIDHFYEPFGWRSRGDERWVHVQLHGEVLDAAGGDATDVRRAKHADLPRIAAAYEALAATVPGALDRPLEGRVWAAFDPAEVTIVERDGELVGWAWRGRGALHERDALAARLPQAAAFGELQAVDDGAMAAVLEAARAFAREAGDEPSRSELVVAAPEAHPLRRLARAGKLECRLVDEVRPHGGTMLLPFTQAGELRGELFQFTPDRF